MGVVGVVGVGWMSSVVVKKLIFAVSQVSFM